MATYPPTPHNSPKEPWFLRNLFEVLLFSAILVCALLMLFSTAHTVPTQSPKIDKIEVQQTDLPDGDDEAWLNLLFDE